MSIPRRHSKVAAHAQANEIAHVLATATVVDNQHCDNISKSIALDAIDDNLNHSPRPSIRASQI
jgi:hypothetical protein